MKTAKIKILILFTLSFAFNFPLFSQRSAMLLKKHDAQKTEIKTLQNNSADEEEPEYYPVILAISENENAEEILNGLEAVVYHHRKNLYLTSIPVKNISDLPRDNRIDKYHLSAYNTACMDVAREKSRVNEAHDELKTLQSITADTESKVVTGICDVGFDPRHAAFANCLKRWVIYDEYKGTRTVFDGYDNILASGPETDEPSMTHATHVGNILAGYQSGSQYYGAAPATDFVATVSQLTDIGICAGIEDVIEYAKNVGKPAVVNISAGSYLGPHDGSDLVGQYLTSLSEDAIICFSAGNYGKRLIYKSHDLDEADIQGCGWCDNSWNGFDVYGGTDLWSADKNSFELRIVLWDTVEKRFLYQSDWMGKEDMPEVFYLNLADTPWFDNGGIWVAWGISPYNDRFNFAIEYDFSTSEYQTAGPWARYVAGYHVREITPDTHVDVYADGIYSFLHGHGIPNCTSGNSGGSISNFACNPNVVAVGAWNSRTLVPDAISGTVDWGLPVDNIAEWSAYGKTVDGRTLPHVSAPGNTVVSAMSSPFYYYEGEKGESDAIAAETDGGMYMAESGTSMSSPFVAGVIALWLEKNPDLTVHEVTDIAVSTANRNFDDINDPRWGAGAIDALAGLREVARRSSVNGVSVDNSNSPDVSIKNGSVCVKWNGVENPTVRVYDLTGRSLKANRIYGNSLLIVKVEDPETGSKFTYKIK